MERTRTRKEENMNRRNFIVTFSGAGAALLAPVPLPIETPSSIEFSPLDRVLEIAREPKFEIVFEDRHGYVRTLYLGRFSDSQRQGLADIRNGVMNFHVRIESQSAWSPGFGRAMMNVEDYGQIAEFNFGDFPDISPGDTVTFDFKLTL
jgi:hypothetical protein